MKEFQAKILVDAKCTLAEGPVYDEASNGLYWTDIKKGRLHFYDLESGEHNYLHIGRNLGCFVLTDRGRILAGLDDGVYLLENARCIPYCKPEEGFRPTVRYNDGKCDLADLCEYARAYSAEIEYSEENTELLLELMRRLAL